MLLPCHLALEHFGGSEKSLNLVHVTDLKKERKILIALTDDIEKKEAKALFPSSSWPNALLLLCCIYMQLASYCFE